jgi:site-specific recombinase XerD
VVESLRMVSRNHGVRDEDVVIHSLKHGALTTLGEAGCSVVDIAMSGGHKSIESSQPYLHPGEAQGARVTQILGQKRGFVGQSDV